MLKGKAEIELTDVKTGEKETIVEENMVTNALSHLFTDNIEGMFWYEQSTGQIWEGFNVPICPNSLGGILLFSEPLVEDAENLYAPSANPCIGYSSSNVDATADPKRGSMNLTESGKIENGYKFVFDFSTSQGNGTISAVALTHRLGGIGFFGDGYGDNMVIAMKENRQSWDSGTNPGFAAYSWKYANCVEIDFDHDLMYSIAMDTPGNIHISTIKKSFRKLRLNATLLDDGTEEEIDEVTITPTTAFVKPSNYSTSYWSYYDFMDGKDGYWYGFLSHQSGGNSSGNADLRWIKIKKSDYSFTEGQWILENVQLGQIGYCSAYHTADLRRTVRCTMCRGYLYVLNYGQTGVYKINVSNVADITFIPFGFKSANATSNYGGCTWMYTWRDYVIGVDYWIDTNDNVFRHVEYQLGYNTSSPFFECGVYSLTYGTYSYGSSKAIYKTLRLVTPYLATINNLGTPVIKTADKTMKITYTVTETE